MKKRKFVEGEINHTYQRTISGGNIFYEVEDYLVYYTIYSIMSVKYKVVVYGLCLMIDHIHSLSRFGKKSGLVEAMKILKGIDDIAINIFTEKDVVRHRLVQDIIKAYERQDARKNK